MLSTKSAKKYLREVRFPAIAVFCHCPTHFMHRAKFDILQIHFAHFFILLNLKILPEPKNTSLKTLEKIFSSVAQNDCVVGEPCSWLVEPAVAEIGHIRSFHWTEKLLRGSPRLEKPSKN